MRIQQPFQQGMTLPGTKDNRPVLKVLFGSVTPYEKPIQFQVSAAPLDTLTVSQSEEHPHIFIRPLDHVAKLFPADNPVGQYLAGVVQSLLTKLGVNAYKDDGGNIISPLKASSAPQAEGDSASKTGHHGILEAFRKALAAVPSKAVDLHVSVPQIESTPETLVRDFSEQTTLQGYNPYKYRHNSEHPSQVAQIILNNIPDTPSVQAAVREGNVLGRATNMARYLVDAPPNVKNPKWVTEQAKTLSTPGDATLDVQVHERKWIQQEKMGLFLSVAAGNQAKNKDAPRLLEMVYTPPNGQYSKTVMLVGKGIIFDTGGTNLKNGGDPKTGKLYIHGMHGDMAGAAAVIGALKAIREMQIPDVRVIGLTPLTPNRIGENATLPHSIFTARNGKTVEISNTDAEGRLVLADAIHYGGEKYKPDLIVDIATLTGGKVKALGAQNSVAVMGNSLDLSKQVATLEEQLGRKTGAYEITEAHRQWVSKDGKGKADLYNSVGMKAATKYNLFGPGTEYDVDKHIIHHSIQGGAFLKEFLHDPKTPWVHLDMAGAEFEPLEHMGGEDYATGFGVKELYTITKQVAEGTLKPKTGE